MIIIIIPIIRRYQHPYPALPASSSFVTYMVMIILHLLIHLHPQTQDPKPKALDPMPRNPKSSLGIDFWDFFMCSVVVQYRTLITNKSGNFEIWFCIVIKSIPINKNP